MPDVFEYTDYRKFLADSYDERKAKSPAFSYKSFAIRAGLKSKSFIFEVIRGKKTLSKPTIVKLSQALGLKKDEAAYFENLVFFNQAADPKERGYFFDQLQGVRPLSSTGRKIQELRKDQYEFYSKWYNGAIRSLVDMHAVKDDYKGLAKKVYPAILPKQAKRSIELLEKLGFIRRQANGVYKISNKSITTGKEVVDTAVLKFQLEAMQLAARAVQELPADMRNVSGLTLGITRKAYERICDEIYQFQEKIMEIANEDEQADNVYRLNFHFFPMSQVTREEKKK